MQRVQVERSGLLIAQRQHRVIVADDIRKRDVEQSSQPVALMDGLLFGEEGIHCDRELAGNPLQESQFRRTGVPPGLVTAAIE